MTFSFDDKEIHDLHIHSMIKALVDIETSYNMKHRNHFADWHHFKGIFDEEHEETVEELQYYDYCIKKMWSMIRRDATGEEFKDRVEVALKQGWQLLHEVVQMQAVLLKAHKQLNRGELSDQSIL